MKRIPEELAAVEGVRARYLACTPDPTANPAWANAEVDIAILLECYNALAERCLEARSALAALTDLPTDITVRNLAPPDLIRFEKP